jgi:glycosyltransferase involved in cell wall biosynthesis
VSAYYASAFLEGRIDNLLEQSEQPDIVVICQDGSKEEEICKQFEITPILTDNIPTIYAAWNMGIKAAKTPYVTNANSDDRLKKDALKIMADVLDKESTYGVVYSDVEVVEQIGGDPVFVYKWIEGGLKELKRGCFIGPMPMWRKSLNEQFGYFDEYFKVCGDYEMWLRFASNGVKFFHVRGEPLGVYLRRGNSAEHREPFRSMWETQKVAGMYREA